MALSASAVKQGIEILQRVNPQAIEVFYESPDNQVTIKFRNCVVTVFAPNLAGGGQMIYTDIYLMDELSKDMFLKESKGIDGAFLLELEDNVTRLGFK